MRHIGGFWKEVQNKITPVLDLLDYTDLTYGGGFVLFLDLLKHSILLKPTQIKRLQNLTFEERFLNIMECVTTESWYMHQI